MDKSPCNCSPLLLPFQVSKSWPCGQMAKPTWGNSPGVFDSSYNTQLRPIPLVRLLCIFKEGTDKQNKNDMFAHCLTWLCEWKTLSTFSCDLKCSSSWNDQSTKQKIPVQTCVVNKQMWGGGLGHPRYLSLMAEIISCAGRFWSPVLWDQYILEVRHLEVRDSPTPSTGPSSALLRTLSLSFRSFPWLQFYSCC